MSQDDYLIFTNTTTRIDDGWDEILAVAEMRLATFLCLDELPVGSDADEYADDLKMLLSQFIYLMVNAFGKGESKISSKSVRNFTISFQTDTADSVFGELVAKYGDIIDKYSACEIGFDVERDWSPFDDRF